MTRTTFLTATAAVFVASAFVAPHAGAAARPRIDLDGFGAVDGTATVVTMSGDATGEPFDGTFTAALRPSDGTLPDPGVCEPATASARFEGGRDDHLELAATGSVCGQHVQPPFVVTQRFTGRFTVVSTSVRRVARTDGHLEVTIANDGRASVFAIDT